MKNVTKLTFSNFLMWNCQVHALLDGYDLAGYINGSTVVPPPTITTDAGVAPNPAFVMWKRQDKLIYSRLIRAITTSIQPILSTTNTSAEIWSILTSTYAKPSRGHIKQVKQKIDNWTKDNKSIKYFQGLTIRFDQLAVVGKPMDHEDQIGKILGGLLDDYKNMVDKIEPRDTAPSLAELHEKMINHAAKLQSAVTPVSSTPVTAHYTNYRRSQNKSNNTRRGGYRRNKTWQQQQQFTEPPHQNSQQNTSHGYQCKCQLCGVFGHSARRCTQLQMSGGSSAAPQQYAIVSLPWQLQANFISTSHIQCQPMVTR